MAALGDFAIPVEFLSHPRNAAIPRVEVNGCSFNLRPFKPPVPGDRFRRLGSIVDLLSERLIGWVGSFYATRIELQ